LSPLPVSKGQFFPLLALRAPVALIARVILPIRHNPRIDLALPNRLRGGSTLVTVVGCGPN
jgi:hypothetical protein